MQSVRYMRVKNTDGSAEDETALIEHQNDNDDGKNYHGNQAAAAKPDKEATARTRTYSRCEKVLGCLVTVIFLLGIAIGIVIGIFGMRPAVSKKEQSPDVCLTEKCVSMASKVLAKMNQTADPCDDFYTFACGGWIQTHDIPSGYEAWDTLLQLNAENTAILRRLLERRSNPDEPKSHEKARTLYRACMDKDQLHLPVPVVEALRPVLDDLGGWPMANSQWNGTDLQTLLEKTMLIYDVMPLFRIDDKLATDHSDSIVTIYPGQLSLSDPSYYFNRTANRKIFEDLKMYMLMVAKGVDKEGKGARESDVEDLFEWETELAESTLGEGLPDTRITVAELQAKYPFMEWKWFLTKFVHRAMSSEPVYELTVVENRAPGVLRQLNEFVMLKWNNETLRRTVINQILWQVAAKVQVATHVPFMSESPRKGGEEFYRKKRGVYGQLERWETCVLHAKSYLPLALGSMFVRETLQGHSKEQAEDLLKRVKSVFRLHLSTMTWLNDTVRNYALSKMDAITDKIGHPSLIMNDTALDSMYADVDVDGTLFDAASPRQQEQQQWRSKCTTTQIGVDLLEANAHYCQKDNDMIFPAGILQSPFFDAEQPVAMNFGGIGMVMGHELTHGFDVEGRRYDKEGKMNDWWTPEAAKAFELKTRCFVDQYSHYQIITGEHVDGNLTISENIADNGGINAAFRAFEQWLKEHGPEPPLPAVPFTPRQLFFVAFAQLHCSKSNAAEETNRNAGDAHSSASPRVIGTLANSPSFAFHFKCTTGDRMNPEQKCDLW